MLSFNVGNIIHFFQANSMIRQITFTKFKKKGTLNLAWNDIKRCLDFVGQIGYKCKHNANTNIKE